MFSPLPANDEPNSLGDDGWCRGYWTFDALTFRNSKCVQDLQSRTVSVKDALPSAQSPGVNCMGFVQRVAFLREVVIHRGSSWNYSGSFSSVLGVRVGEATNPGPMHAKVWSLQVRNIVSAAAHLDEIALGEDQCVVWTETSATQSTLQSLKLLSKTHATSLVHSAPAATRTVRGKTALGRGEASGTLIWSSCKARDLKELWPQTAFQTGRVADAFISVGAVQVRVIACYGFPSSIPNHLGLNELLFQEVFFQANAYEVPTLIVGDLNVNLQDMQCWEKYSALGFYDYGAHVAALGGLSPQPTYRGISRLDYCIANSWAMPYLAGFSVDPRGFTDHGSLHILLGVEAHQPVCTRWAMPFDIASVPGILEDLPSTRVGPSVQTRFVAQICQSDTAGAAASFAHAFELSCQQVATSKGISLGRCFFGRLQGCLNSKPVQRFCTSADGNVLTNQQTFRLRQQTLRRLRELLRAREHAGSAWCATHRCLWRKILHTSGFPNGFANWLLDNDIASFVPETPTVQWLQSVVHCVQHEERLWSAVVQQRQRLLLKHQRDHDWKSGGKQHAAFLKPASAPPLAALPVRTLLQVKHQRTQKGHGAVFKVIAGPMPQPGSIWEFPGGCSALVSKVRGHTVTLADTLKSEMIVSTVTQATWSARPSYVAEQIRQYWCQFWFSEKTPDLDFVKAHLDLLPHLPPFDPVISAAELHWAVRNLKMGKARGLDGFSNAELKSLSPDLFSMLLSLLNHLTSSVTWPANLCQASMAFLAKTLQPDKPADGRPITILGTIYRLWSKIVARKMMLHLLPVLPPSLTGSVPGKSSVSLAFELQSSIEAALLEDASLSGVTMDLSKAYNLINRDVLLLISERLGWPSSVQQSYFAFLKNLRRFITVDKDMSVSSYSDVGVPEGDPIAVTAMIILTFFVSVKLQNDCQTPLSSYVDNWAVQSRSPSEVLSGVDSVAGSVTAIAMSLAVDKLKFYATSADARKQLRGSTCLGQPCCVVHDFQDLGVFFCAARRQTAKCFGTRFQQCQTRFQKLVVAPWADGVKCHSLLRTIVPAVLYGCELTHYSKSSLRMIRGRFSSSLWGQRSRRDHFLAPLLAGAVVYEPFLLILGRRWQAMQRASCQNQDTFRRWWNTAASADESSLLGPFTYFFEQLRQIGWIVEADGFVSDHDGVLWSISWNSWNTVRTLAYTAWVRVITPLVREDEQFSGLQPFQLEQIRSAFTDRKQYNTVLSNYATGAIISSAAKEHYMTSQDACCSLCGSSSGGAVHLLYECPYTKEFHTEAQQLLVALPNAVRVANLVPASIHVGSFRRALAAQSIGSLYTFAEPVHLFTDGSTQHPNDPAVSLSAWSVVLAEQGSVDKTLVHADVLPGVIQSNNRAELFAVVQATLTAPGGHIYSDSQYVVHGWNKLVARGWIRQEWASCSHSDLWYDLYLSLRASVNGWEIHKVTSHLDVASAVSFEQAWCIIHNAFADECAKRANATRPVDILQMHASLCRHRQVQAWRLKHTSELQLLCSDRAKKACKQSSFENAGGKDDIWTLHLERFGMMQHDRTFSIPNADMAFNSLGFLMHKPYGMLLWSWLARQRWVEDAEGMSAAELYTLICLQTGWVSPRNITRIPESERPPGLRTGLSASARVWTHELAWPALALTRESFSAQISTFRVVMAALFKQQGISWSFQPATSLLLFQHPLVTSSLFVRPVSSLDGSAIQYMQRLRRGSSWCSFLARGFTVPTVPLQAPCAEPDVVAVFREWKASSR